MIRGVALGDIVSLKDYPKMMGEVIKITDADKVTISLCSTGLEIVVDILAIEVTPTTQPHRGNSTVNILGTTYKILILEKDDYRYNKEADGWCDSTAKEILLFNFTQDMDCVKDLEAYQRKVLRHEIVHAFLYESGLAQNAGGCKCWSMCEELVDWIAIQEPKMRKAFEEAGCSE